MGDHVSDYGAFLAAKALVAQPVGVDVARDELHPSLFGFQRDLVQWSLRKGRAALFATTGMGKTLMQLDWASHVGERVLILAPLGVARQTVREGERWGIPVTYARREEDAAPQGITITNYEMLDHFDVSAFGAVVLDESSILKSMEGKTRTKLIERFAQTPYRLCCTATPAPNDIAEMANHAEFLGVMTRVEMLSAFFVHDDAGWRLKRHAREPFYRWLASWAMSLTRPSDLGYSDDGYILPPLTVEPRFVRSDYVPDGQLFHLGLKGVGDRARVRKATASDRVQAAAELIMAEPDEKWVVWCGLNKEQDDLAARLGDRCVSVYGTLTMDEKMDREVLWREGDVPTMITKPSVFGHGMNWQHCARMVFVGLGDSWEQYFQAIRRVHRYGQERAVNVHIVLSEAEQGIYENVLRKEREAERMTSELVRHVAEFERAELGVRQRDAYEPAVEMSIPGWLRGGNDGQSY